MHRSRQWPPPPDAMATMDPSSYGTMTSRNPVERRQLYWTESLLPISNEIALQPRLYVVESIVNATPGVVVSRTVQFDIPAVIYAMSGTSTYTDPTVDFPGGLDPRDAFRLRIERASIGDQYTAGASNPLGSAVLGFGDSPAIVGGGGIVMDGGQSLTFSVTPRLAALEIDLVLWAVEVRGPSNYAVR